MIEMIFQIQSRKPNADDAIAELSYRNFMEMSSKTADDKFLQRED
jgi:kynurenine 3-monooxygenase